MGLKFQRFNHYQPTAPTSSDQHTDSDHTPQPMESHKSSVTLSSTAASAPQGSQNQSHTPASNLLVNNHNKHKIYKTFLINSRNIVNKINQFQSLAY